MRAATLTKKATAAQKSRARSLLAQVSQAAKDLEEHVTALVKMRAWEVLGYPSFREMWEGEVGYDAPRFVRVLAVDVYNREGMNTLRGGARVNGHLPHDVARDIGMDDHAVKNVVAQLKKGVPPKDITTSRMGKRARPTPKRMGKTADEMVGAGFSLRRGDDDYIDRVARAAGVSKSEIYRQAVAEYIQRHKESKRR